MNYYAAPMEGLTDRVWRQAHQKWFGPAGNADRYYALSSPRRRTECSLKRRWPSLPLRQTPAHR